MAAEIPCEEKRVPAPNQTPQPRVPVWGREVPIISAAKPVGTEAEGDRGLLRFPWILFKGPTDLLRLIPF